MSQRWEGPGPPLGPELCDREGERQDLGPAGPKPPDMPASEHSSFSCQQERRYGLVVTGPVVKGVVGDDRRPERKRRGRNLDHHWDISLN